MSYDTKIGFIFTASNTSILPFNLCGTTFSCYEIQLTLYFIIKSTNVPQNMEGFSQTLDAMLLM